MTQERDAVVFLPGNRLDAEPEVRPMESRGDCTEEQYDAAMDFHIKTPAAAILVSPFFRGSRTGRFSVNYVFLTDDGRVCGLWINQEGDVTNVTMSLPQNLELAESIEDQYGLFFG